MTDKPYLPYAKPHLDDDDRQAVAEVLTTDQLTRGPWVEAFEEAVATYCGAPYAVAFSNGTSALAAAYFVAQVGSFDQVITSPISYVGSVTGALLADARVRFIDVAPSTGSWGPGAELTFDSTRGRPVYVPVHYAGAPIDMVALTAGIQAPQAVVIEDASHALGATYQTGERVGSCRHSDMTILSFHPVKSITAAEGGMVLTSDRNLRDWLRQFRNNGVRHLASKPWLYTVEFASGNFHLSELHAALGLSQLKKLDAFVAKRRALVAHYRALLADVAPVKLLSPESDDRSAHHLMVTLIDFDAVGKTREEVMQALKAEGVGTQVHYIPLYHHPAVQKLTVSAPCEQAEAFYRQALTLPLYYALTRDDVERVCTTLKTVLGVP